MATSTRNTRSRRNEVRPSTTQSSEHDPKARASARPEGRKKASPPELESGSGAAGRGAAENSIRASRRRAGNAAARNDGGSAPRNRDPGTADDAARAKHTKANGNGSGNESDAPPRVIPDEVRKRFVQIGDKYYFADGARAFTDRGYKLTSPGENTEVIKSLVSIAQARGWNEISVRGTDRFRKEAWLAARLAGLEVRGYRPTEFEQAHIVRTLARQKGLTPGTGAAESAKAGQQESSPRATDRVHSSHQNTSEASRRAPDKLLTGKLVDHGRATYHHDPHEPMSYFLKLETSRGDRTIWGIDLERAMKESLTRPQIGDNVGLRAVRQDAVTVKAHERGADGKVVAEKDLETHRNRWIVEKHTFFEGRAQAARTLRDAAVDPKQAVKAHPELVGTYLQVHAAELAAKQFRDVQDQQRFVAQVRSALADAVARGEPLPPVRLREGAADRMAERPSRRQDREQAPARG
jgi:hypothetical protein